MTAAPAAPRPTTFYNDNDPFFCAWLRELIAAGQIPKGTVDERSITEIQPRELAGFTQAHFFCGIAGWPIALRLAGVPAGFPVWTGSCPCQPLSVAGKRGGERDDRHLWPAFHRLIAECRPAIVFGEQVASADGRDWLAGVFADLEALGYAVAGADLCAAGVGAPHIRQRLFWGAVRGAESERPAGRPLHRFGESGPTQGGGASIQSGRRGSVDRGTDADSGRHQQLASGGDGQRIEPSAGNPWSAFRTVPFGPNKAIRIPQTQPRLLALADSGLAPCPLLDDLWDASGGDPLYPLATWPIKGRVGILRGAGNAIVPALAAEFVKAFLECEA